jgi:hypothetical protein
MEPACRWFVSDVKVWPAQDAGLHAVEELGGEEVQRQDPLRRGPQEPGAVRAALRGAGCSAPSRPAGTREAGSPTTSGASPRTSAIRSARSRRPGSSLTSPTRSGSSESLCREWALDAGDGAFGDWPGTVAAGVVPDPANRTQIQVDVAVLGPEASGEPQRILSLGEAKWDKVMTPGHVRRLRRARDLLAVKGYDTSTTKLTCYSGAGFDDDLRAEARRDKLIQLVGLDTLYA